MSITLSPFLKSRYSQREYVKQRVFFGFDVPHFTKNTYVTNSKSSDIQPGAELR